jgi:DNA sulfur modification protein DndB
MGEEIRIFGVLGKSAGRPVFLGFAPASLLHRISFTDVLDEDTGRGYQRKFNSQHSLDFRKYIQLPGSSTIPLTFNLRPDKKESWRLEELEGKAAMVLAPAASKILAQVDCQHRLGYLNDLELELPFMCYLGLSEREEMEIFNVINSKAKGLSTSLLDFHDATLAQNLASERPELFVALQLNTNPDSPWHHQLDLGGAATSGMSRRASLRTMQKAVKRFLSQTKALKVHRCEDVTRIIIDFWTAVTIVLKDHWEHPRQSLVTKGVGVYALMGLASDLYQECAPHIPDKRYFVNKLSEFITDFDLSSTGALKGLGGEAGVKSALAMLRRERAQHQLRVVV